MSKSRLRKLRNHCTISRPPANGGEPHRIIKRIPIVIPKFLKNGVENCVTTLPDLRPRKVVRSRSLQNVWFSENVRFFYQRRYDIDTLMTWSDWNASQARLLLKMKYDIELIFAAIKRLKNRLLDMRATARDAAFAPAFIEAHKISKEQLQTIEVEPIRAYHPKFIRRRLTLPNGPEHYHYDQSDPEMERLRGWYSEKKDVGAGDLPSLAPTHPPLETRKQSLMKWGKQRVELLEKTDANRAAARAFLKQWIADGKRGSRKSIMQNLGIKPTEFYLLLREVEGRDMPWKKNRYQTKRVIYKGVYVWIPYPEWRDDFSELSPFRKEAYDFAVALDPTFSFSSDTELVAGYDTTSETEPPLNAFDWKGMRLEREIKSLEGVDFFDIPDENFEE